MNRVEIRGGLTRDAEIRSVGSQNWLVAEFSVAVNGTKYDREQKTTVVTTTYVSVQAWTEIAEALADAGGLHQGDEVYVLGELTQHEHEKKDGTKERKTRVNAFRVDVLRRRRPSQAPTDGSFVPQTGAQSGSDPWT